MNHDFTKTQIAELEMLRKQRDELLALVIRYRTETPLGHQPHMIAHLADAAISSVKGKKP